MEQDQMTWREATALSARTRRQELIESIAPTLAEIAEAEAVLKALGGEVEPFQLSAAGIFEPTVAEPPPAAAEPDWGRRRVTWGPEPPEPEPEAPPAEKKPEAPPEPEAPLPPAAREPDEVPEYLRAMPAAQTGIDIKTRLRVARKQFAVYRWIEEHGRGVGPEVIDALERGELDGHLEPGDNLTKPQIGDYLRELADAGLLRRAGQRFSERALQKRAAGQHPGRSSVDYVPTGAAPSVEPPPPIERTAPTEAPTPRAPSLREARERAIIDYLREHGGKAYQSELTKGVDIPTGTIVPVIRGLEASGKIVHTGQFKRGAGPPSKQWALVGVPITTETDGAEGPPPEPARTEAEAIARASQVFLSSEPNAHGFRNVSEAKVARELGVDKAEATNLLREMARRFQVRSTGQMLTVEVRGKQIHSMVWRWTGPDPCGKMCADPDEPSGLPARPCELITGHDGQHAVTSKDDGLIETYAIGDEPLVAAEVEAAEAASVEGPLEDLPPSLELVRDEAVKSFGERQFSAGQLAAQKGWSLDETEDNLTRLAARGTLVMETPTPDLKLFNWTKPKEPGAAATLDMNRRSSEPTGGDGRGAPVPGTGRQVQPSDPDVRQLVSEVRSLGGEAAPVSSGHWEVQFKGRRTSISGTPRSSRSVLKDRSRLRRLGLAV